MKTTTFFTTIIASFGFFAATAQAGPEASQVQQFIEAFDQDGDGAVTRTEMEMALKGMKFRLLDCNGDGDLTEAEWNSVPEQRDGMGEFSQCDCDEDNLVCWAEFSATVKSQNAFTRVFQVLDCDCDNCISTDDDCSVMLVASR